MSRKYKNPPRPGSIAFRHGVTFIKLVNDSGETVGCGWQSIPSNGRGRIAMTIVYHKKFLTGSGNGSAIVETSQEHVEALFNKGYNYSHLEQRELTYNELFNFNIT